MGIRFYCPNGHKLNVKAFQAGRRGICPHCGVGMDIPMASTRPSSKKNQGQGASEAPAPAASVNPTAVAPTWEELEAETELPPPLPQSPLAPSPMGEAAGSSSLVAPAASLGVPTAPVAPGLPSAGPSPLAQPTTVEPPAVPVPGGSAAEPLALKEAPEAVWYVRPPSGGQYGPADREVMRAWLAEGRVTPDSQVWREGWRDWKEAADVFPDSVFPQLRIPDAVPGLERILDVADLSPAGPAAGGRLGARRRPILRRIVIISSLVAAGALVLGAVYLWARWL